MHVFTPFEKKKSDLKDFYHSYNLGGEGVEPRVR